MKMMNCKHKIKLIPASLMFLLLFMSGCYYDQVYIPPAPPPEGIISYADDIQPIWDTKGCMNCHDAGATTPELTPSVSYNNLVPAHVDLVNPSQSIVLTVLTGFMRGSITTSDEALILKWIEQGAQNN